MKKRKWFFISMVFIVLAFMAMRVSVFYMGCALSKGLASDNAVTINERNNLRSESKEFMNTANRWFGVNELSQVLFLVFLGISWWKKEPVKQWIPFALFILIYVLDYFELI
jgi:hypothetical protein